MDRLRKKKVKVCRGPENTLSRDLGSTLLPKEGLQHVYCTLGPGMRNLVPVPAHFFLSCSNTNSSYAHWALDACVLLQGGV